MRLAFPAVSGGREVSHYRRASWAIPRSVDRGFGSLSSHINSSLALLSHCEYANMCVPLDRRRQASKSAAQSGGGKHHLPAAW